MGRPKRLYPLGRYRLHVMGEIDPAKQCLVQLEHTWNRQVIRKGMNIFVRLVDCNDGTYELIEQSYPNISSSELEKLWVDYHKFEEYEQLIRL